MADRGLFSSKNLEYLRTDNGEFIVGYRLGSLKESEKDEVYNIEKFNWIVPDSLAVFEAKTPEGDRLIVTWSAVRAMRDAKTRQDILNKIERKISKKKKSPTTKILISNTNYHKFLKGLDGGKSELNTEAITKDEKKMDFLQ